MGVDRADKYLGCVCCTFEMLKYVHECMYAQCTCIKLRLARELKTKTDEMQTQYDSLL